jgi:hypothetical protein
VPAAHIHLAPRAGRQFVELADDHPGGCQRSGRPSDLTAAGWR